MSALELSLNSFWGSHGSVQGMIHNKDRPVSHIPTLNICYRRLILEKHSGFDESFRRVCEDTELSHRIVHGGDTILYKHDATVIHRMRPNLPSWFRNVALYGYGRVKVLQKHPSHFNLKWIVPPAILFTIAFSILGSFTINPFLIILALGYPAFVGLISIWLCTTKTHLTPLAYVFVILAGNPIFYGYGQLRAFFGGSEP